MLYAAAVRLPLVVALVVATTTCSAPPTESEPHTDAAHAKLPPKGGPRAEIDVADLRDLTAELSSDSYEGRGTGTPAGRRVADAIAAHMQARGLVADPGGFLQPVPLLGSTLSEVSLQWLEGKRATPMRGFVAQSESPSGQHDWTRGVVFVGYGIDTVPGWDDYANVDVTGKIVIALVGEPDAGPFRGRGMSSAGRWTTKLERARAHGAAGCLVVHSADAGYDWAVVQSSFSGERFELRPAPTPPIALRGWLSSETFEQLSGESLLDAQRHASELGGASRPLEGRLAASFTQTTRPLKEHNIVGRVGSGQEPVVVVTAHWDHLGRVPLPSHPDDPIFNGAIDNASGVASLLALASAVGRRHREDPLIGTVYFVSTAAEEQGLLGSRAFARKLPVPTPWVAAAVNFDGMNVQDATPTMELVSAGRSTLDALFGSALARTGRTAVPDRAPQSGAAYRSDHVPFLRLGIPILYPTPGFSGSAALVRAGQERTARYHDVSDEFDPTWSFQGAAADIQAVYEVVLDIADGHVRPRMLQAEPAPTSR